MTPGPGISLFAFPPSVLSVRVRIRLIVSKALGPSWFPGLGHRWSSFEGVGQT
jgi:hypothetical protein